MIPHYINKFIYFIVFSLFLFIFFIFCGMTIPAIIVITILVTAIATIKYDTYVAEIERDMAYKYIPTKGILYSKLENIVKTGDIIMFNPTEGMFEHKCYGCYFKHCGIIINIKNVPHIVEHKPDMPMKSKDNKVINLKSGTSIVPFKKRAEYFQGNLYYIELSKKITTEQYELIMEKLNKIKSNKFPSTFDFVKEFILSSDNSNKVNCMRYVYSILHHANIIKDQNMIGYNLVNFMCKIYEQNLGTEYSYKYPAKILYDL